jgi:hypothetical protein
MCFKININYPEPLIADKDIECYKVLTPNSTGKTRSPFKNTIYHRNIYKKPNVKKSILFFIKNPIEHTINYGLHSCSTLERAEYWRGYGGNKIYLAIIPKGSRYYYNPEKHEYVSKKLIVTNKIVK